MVADGDGVAVNWLIRWSPLYFHSGWRVIGPIAYARLLWRRVFWQPDLLPMKPTAQGYACSLKDLQRELEWMAKQFARDEDIAWAHACEDRIRESVLRAISEGAPNPIALATLALDTKRIEFTRGFK